MFYETINCDLKGSEVDISLALLDVLSSTYRKRRMPVLAIAYASPRIPLPMMALLRLKTDIPKEVFPSNCKHSQERKRERLSLSTRQDCSRGQGVGQPFGPQA